MKKSKLFILLTAVVLVVFTAVLFVGCVPKTADKVIAKLEKAGYTVYSAETDEEIGAVTAFVEEYSPDYAETIEDVLYADNAKASEESEEEEEADMVVVLFVSDKESAKALYDDLAKFFAGSDEEEEEEEETESNLEIRRAGNIVYYGTAAGLRAANK